MIKVENLNKTFGSFQALKNVNINVKKGEIYGFLGHNGAGKSTTINILTGLSRPTSGNCYVNGYQLSKKLHPGDLHIGYLPEEPKFYPWMTGLEVLEYLGSIKNKSFSRQRIDEVVEWIGLTSAVKRKVGGYSRGMRQRLGIGTALLHDPELLLLDEPSSALDPEGRSDVLKLIIDLKERGKTVFFSTHILNDVERVCDSVAILNKGEVVLEKPLNDLLKENIMQVYDITVKQLCNPSIIKQLKQIPGVERVESKGNCFSVWVKDTEEISVKLFTFLASTKLNVQSFLIRTKNLEDIFLKEVSNSDFNDKKRSIRRDT